MGDLSNEIPSFNPDIAKKNISDIMRQKNIKQKDIVELLVMSQPDVSKCLKLGHERFFSIEQLFKISLFLDISLDKLTGRTLCEKNLQNDDFSLSDVCETLYSLDFIANPTYCETKTTKGIPRTAIYFHNDQINDLVNKFFKARDISKEDTEYLEFWKNRYESKHRLNFKKYDFKTEYDYGSYYLERMVSSGRIFDLAKQALSNSSVFYQYNHFKADLSSLYGAYTELQRQCMYRAIDRYIKEKNFRSSSVEIYILNLFRTIYEENHIAN